MEAVNMTRPVLMCAVLALSGCGLLEVHIDETRGVKPLSGTTTVDLPTSAVCTGTFTSNNVTVVATQVTGGCQFTIDESLEVLKPSDYASISELSIVTNLLKRVELTIKTLAFTDVTTPPGVALDLTTQVDSATFTVNGQQIADRSTLTGLPKTVVLSGAALDPVKSAFNARHSIEVHVVVVVVIKDGHRPSKLKIDFAAQPDFILGP
jgi:hypothetical protein